MTSQTSLGVNQRSGEFAVLFQHRCILIFSFSIRVWRALLYACGPNHELSVDASQLHIIRVGVSWYPKGKKLALSLYVDFLILPVAI